MDIGAFHDVDGTIYAAPEGQVRHLVGLRKGETRTLCNRQIFLHHSVDDPTRRWCLPCTAELARHGLTPEDVL